MTTDAASLFSLTGKSVLVTGASGGLGQHFARILANAGASVWIASRAVGSLAGLADEIGGKPVALDVTSRDSVVAAFDITGPVDILVNNAGIAASKSMLSMTEEDWDSVVDVNLRGAFMVAREAAGRLVKAGQPGVIVNIASIVGLRPMTGLAAYAAAKAGLLHVTRQMAVELARHRIRVNALAPGYILTSMNREFFDTDTGKAMIQRIPQRRLGIPDDLAGPLLLLASEASAHMTGATITVDGGHSINSL